MYNQQRSDALIEALQGHTSTKMSHKTHTDYARGVKDIIRDNSEMVIDTLETANIVENNWGLKAFVDRVKDGGSASEVESVFNLFALLDDNPELRVILNDWIANNT